MRHVWSLLAGLMAAPVVWVLTGTYLTRGSELEEGGPVSSASFSVGDLAMESWTLLCAGLLIGLIGATRISPLGPAVASLVLVGVHALVRWDLWQPPTYGVLDPAAISRPAVAGVPIIVAAGLLVALFSGSRWRPVLRSDHPERVLGAVSRHWWSLLAGLLVAPAAWTLIGLGLSLDVNVGKTATAGAASAGQTALALSLLAAGGVAVGVIGATRVSPVGPVVAGVLFVGATGFIAWRASADPRHLDSIRETLPFDVWGVAAADIFTAPARATALVLGVWLITSLLSVRRWRSEPKLSVPEDTFEADNAAQIGSPTPEGARRPLDAEEPTTVDGSDELASSAAPAESSAPPADSTTSAAAANKSQAPQGASGA